MGLATQKDNWKLSDDLWDFIEPSIPKVKTTHPLGCHRRRIPDRQIMTGILFVLRTGCQWRALDGTGICSGATAHRRFMQWTEAGVFRKLWRRGLQNYDTLVGIDWRWLSVDGAMQKAPLGGKSNGTKPYRPREMRDQA